MIMVGKMDTGEGYTGNHYSLSLKLFYKPKIITKEKFYFKNKEDPQISNNKTKYWPT